MQPTGRPVSYCPYVGLYIKGMRKFHLRAIWCVVDPSHWPALVQLLDLLSGSQAVRSAHVSQISYGSRDAILSGVGSTPFMSVTPGPASTHVGLVQFIYISHVYQKCVMI